MPKKTLELLVNVFTELRNMADMSLLTYPYSTRELVNICRHLQMFPNESMKQAVANVFDFDAFSRDTINAITEVFERRGVKLGN